MSLSLDDAAEAKDEAQTGNLRESPAGVDDRFDYEENEAPDVEAHPEIMLTFDRIRAIDFGVFGGTPEDFLDLRQNVQQAETGPNGEPWGRDAYVILENPQLVDGQVWSDDDDYNEYKLVGDVSSEYSPYEQDISMDDDGNAVVDGVDLGMGGFEGDQIDALNEDFIQLNISGRRAAEAIGVLDTAGRWSHTEDGRFVGGLFEVPPEFGTDDYEAETHGGPRAIGYPELRADMVGQRGAIAVTFDSDDPDERTSISIDFFTVEDGDLGELLTPVSPGEDAYNKPEYPRAGNLYWEHDDNVDSQDMGADVEPETSGGLDEAKSMMTDDDSDETTFDDLTESEKEFVEAAVEGVNTKGYDSVTEFDDWDERYEMEATGENPDVEVDQDTIATIIDNRL